MMIPSWAYVGAKVVCKTAFGAAGTTIKPMVGTVYTIREFDEVDIDPFIRLVEIVQRAGWDGFEPSFDISYFRPVHTRRSDVRMVKSLVRKMPASERLDRLEELLNETAP